MNPFEAKRAAKIKRMRQRAERLAGEAEGAVSTVSRMAETIGGTPLLRGHHSEAHHRRDIDKMDRLMRKSIDAQAEADALAARARRAENSTAVSSDDPEAVEKLREKLARLNADRELAVKVNAAVRIGRRGGDYFRAEGLAALARLGFEGAKGERLLEPDDLGNFGVPRYRLTNMGSEARRLEKRIAELEARAATPPPAPETVNGVRIEQADNRVRMLFDGRPAPDIIAHLKSAGFRWAPSEKAWQRMASTQAWYCAREIAGKVTR